jgi:hypothetical protein
MVGVEIEGRKEEKERTFAILEQLSVPLTPRLKLRIGVLPRLVSLLKLLLAVGSLKLDRVEPNASSTLVSETASDDTLDKGDDLGDVLGNASQGRGALDVKGRHRVEERILPVSGEVAEDGGVGDTVAELRKRGH